MYFVRTLACSTPSGLTPAPVISKFTDPQVLLMLNKTMLLVYNMKNKFDMDSIVSKISTNPNWLGFSIFFTALALFIDWMVASKS